MTDEAQDNYTDMPGGGTPPSPPPPFRPPPPPRHASVNMGRNISLFFGAVLLLGGGLILFANLLPLFGFAAVDWPRLWPVVFFVSALLFFAPAFVFWPVRQGLSALFIPGTMVLTLGLILQYQVLSNDWVSWSYAWLLLLGSVGFGLTLASWVGDWGRGPAITGIVIGMVFVGIFAIFASIFGGPLLKTIAPVLFIVFGGWLLIRSFVQRE